MSPTFRSFAAPNYRIFFVGALISNIGTWMSRVAQDWLVLVDLTDHSATAVGLVTGVQFLPALLLAPWAGMIADRFPKRRVIEITQSAMLVTSLIQAALILTGVVQLWHVFLLAALQGVASAVDAPARQTFVSEIVGPELLANAVGLNSASFNAARLIGPGVAGLMIAAWGTGWVFLVNGLSFLAILLALGRLETATLASPRRSRGGGQIRAGLAYVRHRPDIILLMVIVFLLGTFGLNFQMTTALMATTIYDKGPGEYGLLGSIMAIGSLTAALLAARRPRPRLRIILAALVTFAISSCAAALAPSYELFAVLLIPVGLSALTILPSANSMIQLSVDPEMRGRVMALYMAIFMGGTPLGAPIIGWVGQNWGARWTILVGSVVTLLTAVGATIYIMRTDHLRLQPVRSAPFLVVSRDAEPLPEVAA
jgi:MFS family permease